MDKLKTIQTVENHLNALLKKVESAVAAGTTITNDILKVKLKINETTALKSKTTNAITLCKMNLCQQIGLSLDSVQTFEITAPDFATIESPAAYYVLHGIGNIHLCQIFCIFLQNIGSLSDSSIGNSQQHFIYLFAIKQCQISTSRLYFLKNRIHAKHYHLQRKPAYKYWYWSPTSTGI